MRDLLVPCFFNFQIPQTFLFYAFLLCPMTLIRHIITPMTQILILNSFAHFLKISHILANWRQCYSQSIATRVPGGPFPSPHASQVPWWEAMEWSGPGAGLPEFESQLYPLLTVACVQFCLSLSIFVYKLKHGSYSEE